MRRAGWKYFAVAAAVFLCVLLVGFCMLGSFGLAFFNVVFGWETYAVNIVFKAVPAYGAEKITSVSLGFDITLAREKVPVEALAAGCFIHTFQGDNVNLNLKLHVFIYVLNRVQLFDRTFSFTDLNPRLIKVYLPNVPAEAQQIHVEIDGSYMLNGEETRFSGYGGTFTLEA